MGGSLMKFICPECGKEATMIQNVIEYHRAEVDEVNEQTGRVKLMDPEPYTDSEDTYYECSECEARFEEEQLVSLFFGNEEE